MEQRDIIMTAIICLAVVLVITAFCTSTAWYNAKEREYNAIITVEAVRNGKSDINGHWVKWPSQCEQNELAMKHMVELKMHQEPTPAPTPNKEDKQ